MDAKLKAKWVKALRSGKFKQARGALWDREANAYCCLGVLCRLQGASDKWLLQQGTEIFLGRRLAGLDDQEASELCCLNDGWMLARPRTFKQIATHIEKHIKAENPGDHLR